MPKNVGRYQQGGMKTMPDWTNESGGEPKRHPPAPPAPKSQLPVRENGKTVGNNDGKTAH